MMMDELFGPRRAGVPGECRVPPITRKMEFMTVKPKSE
jgi:hypothetical protein